MVLRARFLSRDDVRNTDWNAEAFHSFVKVAGYVFLGVDAWLFHQGAATIAWGGEVSFTTLVATVIYVSVMVFAKLHSIKLEAQAMEN